MRNDMFIPEKIKVGYQKRSDTYSKKLAYVIYYDEKGVLRKEKSWEGWRDSKISADDFDNVPTSGFVLNKKAGGDRYSWNPRQTYIRVYDPRGFEIEITVPNLLYILENTDCTKGKGLEGEFVYGWSGTELILMPTCSPDYTEIAEYTSKMLSNKCLEVKDLKEGATYLTKKNNKYVYIGRFESFDNERISVGKKYVFAKENEFNGHINYYFESMTSIKDLLIDTIDENCIKNYKDLLNKLDDEKGYSGGYIVKKEKSVWEQYTLAEFKKLMKNEGEQTIFLCNKNSYYSERPTKATVKKIDDKTISVYAIDKTYSSSIVINSNFLTEDFYKKYKLLVLRTYNKK